MRKPLLKSNDLESISNESLNYAKNSFIELDLSLD